MSQRKTTLELELGGKVRPLRFDMAFLDALADLMPLKELFDLADARPWKILPYVITAGLMSAAEDANLPIDFDLKKVEKWIPDVEDPEDLHRVVKQYQLCSGFFGVAVIGQRVEAEAEIEPETNGAKGSKPKTKK